MARDFSILHSCSHSLHVRAAQALKCWPKSLRHLVDGRLMPRRVWVDTSRVCPRLRSICQCGHHRLLALRHCTLRSRRLTSGSMRANAAIVFVFWAFLIAPGLCGLGLSMSSCPYSVGTAEDESTPCSSNPYAQISVPAHDLFAPAKTLSPPVVQPVVLFDATVDVHSKAATRIHAHAQTQLRSCHLHPGSLPLLL